MFNIENCLHVHVVYKQLKETHRTTHLVQELGANKIEIKGIFIAGVTTTQDAAVAAVVAIVDIGVVVPAGNTIVVC